MLNVKTVLVLAPHPDDLEIGCGATIARLVEEGAKVYELVFAEPKQREPEMMKAARILGVHKLYNFNLLIRNFDKCRQEILDKLIVLKNRIKPDLVIMPSLNDIHQDHVVVANEGLRAFKGINLLGYEALWNNLNFEAQMFVKINERQLKKKVAAVQCYVSQNDKKFVNEEYTRSLMKVRGVQIGYDYAEVFNVIRMVA